MNTELNLPHGMEITEDAGNMYLHCLACAMLVGTFGLKAEPKLVEDKAIEHTMGVTHQTVTKIINTRR